MVWSLAKLLISSGCCFHEVSLKTITYCSSPTPHPFCFICARKYSEAEIGNMRINLVCLDASGCSAPFPESEIQKFLDSRTFQGLAKLRTDHEIKQANLEGLVYCPFCPFAAILEDPTDRIFECINCGINSCRHCRVKDHHPLTCAENKLAAKHVVEEAMTEAFVRKCNNCNTAFLKEEGCNRMKCACGNLQCYVCSSNVVNYSHFDEINTTGKGCPLYGDMQDLLKEQVAAAQERTIRELLETRSCLEDHDLWVDKRVETDLINLEVPKFLPAIPQLLPPYPCWNPVRHGAHQNPDRGFGRIHRTQNHRCTKCNRTFGSVDSLSQHQKATRNKKNHIDGNRCVTCGKSFGSPSSRSQHELDKHGPNAQRPKRKHKGPIGSSLRKKRKV